MAEAGVPVVPEALAGLGDTPRHQGDTAPAKQLELGLEPAAGAAVGMALLVRHHHHASDKTQTYVTGCPQSVQDGISLTNEKDNQTYSIMSSTDPNRFNGLYGAARSAELLRQPRTAAAYYAQLLKNCEAPSQRPELLHAKELLTGN